VSDLRQRCSQEIQEILDKYPPDQRRSAVMPLLLLAQREFGHISPESLQEIAEITGVSSTEVGSVSGFYTLFHFEAEGRYRIQVCTDLPCALRGADAFLEQLGEKLGIHPGQTTADGVITLEEVKCLAACHRAPMFQVQGDGKITYHENQTVESAMELVEKLRGHVQENQQSRVEGQR